MRYFIILITLILTSCINPETNQTHIVVLEKDIHFAGTTIETDLGTFKCDRLLFGRLILHHTYEISYYDGYERVIIDAKDISKGS
jgi:hypothetical protein